MSTPEDRQADLIDQAFKFKTVLEAAFAKPRLDVAAMREQTLSNAMALVVMNHVHCNLQGNVLGLNPPPMIITTKEGDGVRAHVVAIVREDFTGQYHMRTEMRGALGMSDADALQSLYEESRRIMTNAKLIMERMGFFAVI